MVSSVTGRRVNHYTNGPHYAGQAGRLIVPKCNERAKSRTSQHCEASFGMNRSMCPTLRARAGRGAMDPGDRQKNLSGWSVASTMIVVQSDGAVEITAANALGHPSPG